MTAPNRILTNKITAMNKFWNFLKPNQHKLHVQSCEVGNMPLQHSVSGKLGNHHQEFQEETNPCVRLESGVKATEIGARSVRDRWYASTILYHQKRRLAEAENTCSR